MSVRLFSFYLDQIGSNWINLVQAENNIEKHGMVLTNMTWYYWQTWSWWTWSWHGLDKHDMVLTNMVLTNMGLTWPWQTCSRQTRSWQTWSWQTWTKRKLLAVWDWLSILFTPNYELNNQTDTSKSTCLKRSHQK